MLYLSCRRSFFCCSDSGKNWEKISLASQNLENKKSSKITKNRNEENGSFCSDIFCWWWRRKTFFRIFYRFTGENISRRWRNAMRFHSFNPPPSPRQRLKVDEIYDDEVGKLPGWLLQRKIIVFRRVSWYELGPLTRSFVIHFPPFFPFRTQKFYHFNKIIYPNAFPENSFSLKIFPLPTCASEYVYQSRKGPRKYFKNEKY